MTAGKLAAQSVHAAMGLATIHTMSSIASVGYSPAFWISASVVVLGVSDTKFNEAKNDKTPWIYVVHDAGYTEVPTGTETCLAYLEEDERAAVHGND